MDAFEVAPPEGFDPRQALTRMLELLRQLINMIAEFRETLILTSGGAPADAVLDDAFLAARGLAMDDLDALIVLVGEADFDAPAMIEHRLQGEALRFKMLTIQAAFRQVVASHPNQNPGMSRGWSLYRRALRGTLAAIDGPLESLTAALGAKQGLVEFKKALEVLLDL
ncbi:hypothetical protein D3C77_182440 [compost metagenome]|jgi:hypothetical protein